ncbi:hypothetical protein HNP88_000377 [Methanococcus maripaludis]|uniref:Uncharacterized protein n=1 Tax=Methanococcus maripaludis TaxID=39152 RepID=A0A7J9NL85_METMI|nr:hypothetical protein [Methanococcus maripaludis]MBA2846193.1 hypothetical protein [Methanococcus maripaludis]
MVKVSDFVFLLGCALAVADAGIDVVSIIPVIGPLLNSIASAVGWVSISLCCVALLLLGQSGLNGRKFIGVILVLVSLSQPACDVLLAALPGTNILGMAPKGFLYLIINLSALIMCYDGFGGPNFSYGRKYYKRY